MGKKIIILLAIVVALGISIGISNQRFSTPAATPNPTPGTSSVPGTQAAPSPKVEKFSGVLESIDQKGHTLVVQKRKKEMTFYWNDETRITKGKTALNSRDLKIGEHLKVSYTEQAGKAMADKIKVSKTVFPPLVLPG